MNIQYIFAGGDFDDDLDQDEVIGDPWELAQREGINILSDKELLVTAVDMDLEGGIVVGAVFTSVTPFDDVYDYSFDTVVDRRYQGRGIGAELIEIGMGEFSNLQDAYGDELVLMLDVVNEGIVPHLERKYGLQVLETEGNHFIMGEMP